MAPRQSFIKRNRETAAFFLAGVCRLLCLPCSTGRHLSSVRWHCGGQNQAYSQPVVYLDRESRAVLTILSSLEAFDLQTANIFEVFADIREERETVLKGRCTDHEIEIRAALTLGA